MRERQQSTSTYVIPIVMRLSLDHITLATGKTVAVRLSKNGLASVGASGAISEVDSANAPGQYAVAGNTTDTGTLGPMTVYATATGCDPFIDEYNIVAYNPFDAVRLGLTALPNANAEAAGGLYTRGSGAGQINQPGNGLIDINAKQWLGGVIPAVSVTGVPLVDIKYLLGTAFTEGAVGRLVAGIKQFFDVAAPTSTMNEVTLVDTTTTLTNAPSDSSGVTTLLSRIGAALTISGGAVDANIIKTLGTTLAAVAGYVGLDWSHINAPTTAVDFTGTTIKNVDNAIANVTTVATTTNLTNAPTAGDFTAAMKTSLNAATPAVTVSDKTGFSLSAAGVQAIWDALTSALTTVGSIGKLLVSGGSVPTVSQIVNGVWDEPNASHVAAGSTGKNLSTAGSGADPLLNAVPGAYAVGTAGYDLGHIYSATQTTPISFVNPVDLTQTTVGPLVPGNDYRFADGFQLPFTSPYGSTNLVGGSVVYKGSTLTGGTLSVAGTIVDATHVYIELTAAQSAQLAQGTFSVEATLPTSGHILTLAYGTQDIAIVQGMPS